MQLLHRRLHLDVELPRRIGDDQIEAAGDAVEGVEIPAALHAKITELIG